MRFASYDRFAVSPWRIVGVGVAASFAASLAMGLLFGDALGEAETPALLVLGVLVFYIVVSTPRRLADRQRVIQAREALLLSAATIACLKVTGSRPRTLLLLRPREGALDAATREAGRRVLLGTRVGTAIADCSRNLTSYSAAVSLRNLASMHQRDFDASDEETRGLANLSELSRETRLPIFMTVCFFLPIMLVLYAVFSHTYDAGRLAELTAFEFVVVDLAFYFSSVERGAN